MSARGNLQLAEAEGAQVVGGVTTAAEVDLDLARGGSGAARNGSYGVSRIRLVDRAPLAWREAKEQQPYGQLVIGGWIAGHLCSAGAGGGSIFPTYATL
jgi:hypothetical protein